MNRPRIVPRLTVNEQLAIAAACGVLGAMLGAGVGEYTTAIDRAVRRRASLATGRRLRPALRTLFVLGLPGAYIPIAYATGLWVKHCRRRGGPAIVAAAWMGWFAHRGVKLIYVRPRPSSSRPRVDSYPSGHTMGITALSLVIGHVFSREEMLSLRASAGVAAVSSAVMGASRVIADDHWMTDVIGGWLFGAAVGGVVSAISDRV
jgi:membrane-associated phospholipid phosphatase